MIRTVKSSLLIVGGNEVKRDEKANEIFGFNYQKKLNNPDFLFLYSPTNIGIAEIRNLTKFLSLKPFQEENKIVFIKDAQNLTIEAQNALLKTLEEPPVNSQIILTSPNESLLLSTVVSRCQIIEIPSEPQVELDQKEFQNLVDLLDKLINSSIGERFKLIEEQGVYKNRETAVLWLDKLTYVIRKLMLSEYLKKETISSVPLLPSGEYLNLLSQINQTKTYLQANCNVRLTIEVFLYLTSGVSQVGHIGI